MKTFTGAVISAYLTVGMPLQAQAESALEVPHMVTVPSEAPSLPAASWTVQVTASEPAIQVGETVNFHAVFEAIAPSVTEVYGWLRSPVNESGEIQQERLLRFFYSEEKKGWIAQYTATPYDVTGDWTLELWSFSDTLYKTQNAVSFALNNSNPLQDEEAPRLKAYTLLYNNEPFQDASSVKQEGLLAVHVQAFDDASGIHAVTAKLLKQQTDIQSETADGESAGGSETKEEIKQEELKSSPNEEHIVMPLLYNVQTSEWIGVFDIATVTEGEYELVLEMKDYMGNVTAERTGSKIVVMGKEPLQDIKEEIPPASPVEQPPAAPAPTPIGSESEKMPNTPVVEQAAPQVAKVVTTPVVQKEAKKEGTPPLPPKKETKEGPVQQSKQSSLLFYAAGALLLISVLRSNKEWSE